MIRSVARLVCNSAFPELLVFTILLYMPLRQSAGRSILLANTTYQHHASSSLPGPDLAGGRPVTQLSKSWA